MSLQRDCDFADVHKLTEILRRLAGDGNTVIVIEHNLDVIKDGRLYYRYRPGRRRQGRNGGGLRYTEEIAQSEKSYTGKYIDAILKKK